ATSTISSSGIHWNSGRTSARPRAKKVSTQKKTNRVTARKAPRKRNPAGDAKKPASSLRAVIPILLSASRMASRGMAHLRGLGNFRRRRAIDPREQRCEIASLECGRVQTEARLVHGGAYGGRHAFLRLKCEAMATADDAARFHRRD